MSVSVLQSIPANLIVEVAIGREPLDVIAQRYGIEFDVWRDLEMQPWFVQEVSRKRAELAANGTLFKQKVGLGAEVALDEIMKRVMKAATGDKDLLEMFKHLTKLAGHDPQPGGGGAGGEGFTIHINVPSVITQNGAQTAAIQTADGKPVPSIVIETGPATKAHDDIPGKLPEGFIIPDFDLTNAALRAMPPDVAAGPPAGLPEKPGP